MSRFVFDDFARTTLGAAYNISDESQLTAAQIERIIAYLRSPASGPDGKISYADFIEEKLNKFPPTLPDSNDYIAYSGKDRNGASNFDNALSYSIDTGNSSGIIGDTPFGKYLKTLENTPEKNLEFILIERNFKAFMIKEGVSPLDGSHAGALRDMMWNAGSPKFFENAIATGKPLVAFVDGAPANRGFSNFELTTALDHPDARINGYPVSAFGSDPL